MLPFLSLLFLVSLLPLTLSQSPKGIFIHCGATVSSVINGTVWAPDPPFISAGIPKNLASPLLFPSLSTVRSFPRQNNLFKKFCYVIPVSRSSKYLVRTTYYYGGVNGNASPPVFDQIVEGTFWSVVNTTEDYVRGNVSYYEGVFVAQGKSLSVCVASNTYTESDPFISALEIFPLIDSLYNSTDFGNFGLHLVARHSFGHNGSITRYPDDQFDRYWYPFGENTPASTGAQNVDVSGFWNLPPSKVFETLLTVGLPEPLQLQWPPASLRNSTYYIALYFADDRNSTSVISRVFNISVNGILFYQDLNVIPSGVVVFANQWPLGGFTSINLTPAAGSTIGPLINGGEVFEVLPLGGRTLTRDVIALESVKKSFQNPPPDWNGDPCLPPEYPWTGVTCSGGARIRIVALNLTSMRLSGSISHSIANLTALTDIWLGNSSLSGSLPDLSTLHRLQTLHLEDNLLTGEIPPSLGNMDSLRELFLQNNNLTGQLPTTLIGKAGLDLRVSPGNPLLLRPPNS